MSSTPAHTFVPSDEIRARFSSAMSEMYRDEVPQYGTLIELVADINQRTLQAEPALLARMQRSGELARLGVERHGAIRVGTAAELSMLRRLFRSEERRVGKEVWLQYKLGGVRYYYKKTTILGDSFKNY